MKHKSFRTKRHTKRKPAKRTRRTRRKHAKRTYAKRTYKMRGGTAAYPANDSTTGGSIKQQNQAEQRQSAGNNALKGGGGGRRYLYRRKQTGGACDNSWVACPPLGMVGPIPQTMDAISNTLISRAAGIGGQSTAYAVYDNPPNK